MRYCSTVQRLAGGFLMAIMTLAGCQRASYSFQGSPPESLSAEANVPADTAAPGKAIAAVAAGGRGRLDAPPPHAGRTRHWMRPVALRPAAAVALPRSKVWSQPSLAKWQPKRSTVGYGLPANPKPYHRGVAFALAVLLGFFGTHLFYLGHNRDGFRYLTYTLIGIALLAIAVPVGMSSAFGGGFGGVVVALYLLLGGILCIGAMYLHALFDAIQILTGNLAP